MVSNVQSKHLRKVSFNAHMTVTTDHNTSKLLVAFLSNLSSGLGMAKKIRRFGYSKLHNTECHIRQTLYHNNCVCVCSLGHWDGGMHWPLWMTMSLGQKQPGTQRGGQGGWSSSVPNSLSHVWGHRDPHSVYSIPPSHSAGE